MQVRLLVPRNRTEGEHLESVAIFASRRCRTTKEYDELWQEVMSYTPEKRKNFLQNVVNQEWAADVLEMIQLVYDVEGVPVWLVIELLRHRLVAREFGMEQLSQRAIAPFKLQVEIRDSDLRDLTNKFIEDATTIAKLKHLTPEDMREAFPQGVLVNFCIAGNLRAFMHFFFMRSSELFQGKGGAHKKFMDLSDSMQEVTKERLPITMETILRA